MLATGSYKIVIIGAGNVATHLGKRLQKKGHEILQVISRSEKSAKELAVILSCAFTTDIAQVNRAAQVYLFCVPDEEIIALASRLKLPGKLVLHTSGSIRMGAIRSVSSNCGVLYPVYSFSKQVKVSFSSMPLLIEASNKNALADLLHLAHSVGKHITQVNSEERMRIHLAAVFVNNFTNFMFSQAYDFLKGENQSHFHLLQPLIRQTVKKIKNLPPALVQTGPARRNDSITIEKHLELLARYPDQKQVYQLLSALIKKQFHGK